MGDDTQDLLNFGSISVFYIGWKRRGTVYYLSDMTNNANKIMWTTHQGDALYFYTEKEAAKHVKFIKTGRPGVSLITGEIDVLEDFDSKDFP